MKKITVSAPGKLLVFGEHAAVHNKPCIVTAVNQRLKLEVSILDEEYFELEAPDVEISNYRKKLSEVGKGDISKGAQYIEVALKNFLSNYPQKKGFKFKTFSEFKATFGFGSSSAAAVCTTKALSEILQLKLSNKEIFDLSYKTILDIAGIGSGVDLAAAIYGGTLLFVIGGKVTKPISVKNFSLIVGYSGTKANTPTILKDVKSRFAKNPKLLKNIFDGIELIVKDAKAVFEKNDSEKIGTLMNLNQGYLETLGVSSEKLSAMIYAARNSGAYGAKLSGAGVGDCMIALAPENKRKAVEKAIGKVGGQILKVEVNAQGVKIEK